MTTSGLTVSSPLFPPFLFACVCHINFVMNGGQEANEFLTMPLQRYRFVDVQCHSFIFLQFLGFHVFWDSFPVQSHSANYVIQEGNGRQQVNYITYLYIICSLGEV